MFNTEFERKLSELQNGAEEVRTLAAQSPDPVLRIRLTALADERERDIRRLRLCRAA